MDGPAPPSPASDLAAVGREVIAACRALGFALAGIADATPSGQGAELRAWLAAGKHGTMAWMEELLEERLDITRMLAGARSVVMVADLYAPPPRRGEDASLPPGHARVARYARGADYHTVMKRRLHRVTDALRKRFPGHEFRAFVDTGPVMEREQAARAGLGWIGKHTLLINPRLGSYLLLGGFVTTLELLAPGPPVPPAPPAPPAPGLPGLVPDHCGTCTRCIDACPTAAITPYSVDARRCISYLTIEHAGDMAPALRERLGDWAFGCDVCQEVCPFNAPTRTDTSGGSEGGRAVAVFPSYRADIAGGIGAGIDVVAVMGWGEAAHRRAVSGTALKRATLAMMKRNAAHAGVTAAEHGEKQAILEAARRLAGDEHEAPAARAAALEAVGRLVGG